jgi:hypothetical protein
MKCRKKTIKILNSMITSYLTASPLKGKIAVKMKVNIIFPAYLGLPSFIIGQPSDQSAA